jgi:hypothetical protein
VPYPGGYRRRADFFYAAWARTHNMTIMAARQDPAAQGYYQEAYGRGRFRAARAWAAAGVVERDEITGDWEYTEEYAR